MLSRFFSLCYFFIPSNPNKSTSNDKGASLKGRSASEVLLHKQKFDTFWSEPASCFLLFPFPVLSYAKLTGCSWCLHSKQSHTRVPSILSSQHQQGSKWEKYPQCWTIPLNDFASVESLPKLKNVTLLRNSISASTLFQVLFTLRAAWLTSLHIFFNRLILNAEFMGSEHFLTHRGSRSAAESGAWWVTCLDDCTLASQYNLDWSTASALYPGCHSPEETKETRWRWKRSRGANRETKSFVTGQNDNSWLVSTCPKCSATYSGRKNAYLRIGRECPEWLKNQWREKSFYLYWSAGVKQNTTSYIICLQECKKRQYSLLKINLYCSLFYATWMVGGVFCLGKKGMTSSQIHCLKSVHGIPLSCLSKDK